MEEHIVRDSKLLALMERTGYNIVQENGQRKYGPPPTWIGSQPPKGSEIFVGKLPRDLFEDELVPLFEKVGMIYELRLMMDFSGSNRGYGFVTYTNNDDAQKAIRELNDFEIRRGRRIGVCKSVDNCRLFIGGIPKHKNKEEIMNEISKYTEGVSSVILYNSVTDKSKNRGFAFVEYENHRAAAMARRKLIPGRITLFDNEIAVDWAEPEPQVEEDTMKRVTVLYVRNLSMLTTEDDLRLLFSLGGALKVEKVKKIRDFAFIHYAQRGEAERALATLDGTSLNNCEIEVTWAKPPESQKLKSAILKSDGYLYQYGQTNFDSFDHNTDLSLSPSSLLPGYSFLPRTAARNHNARLQAQSFLNSRNSVGIKPTQLLTFICHEKGWGDPVFQVQHISSDSIDAALLFACKVTIPGLPSQVNQFFPNKVCRSPDEARTYAAQYVLKKMGFSSDYVDFPVSSPASPFPNSHHGFLKNYMSSSNSLGLDVSSPSPQMTYPLLKSQMRSHSYSADILDRGQGDAHNFMPTSSDDLSLGPVENPPPLLDPNTAIEPTSILGLLAAAAAAANIELPIFK